MEYEIERKFLLKNLPEVKYDKILLIYQYYLEDDGDWTDRIRKISSSDGIIYLRTRKLKVSRLANEEDEIEITIEEYEEIKKSAVSKVIKKRHVINYGDYKWEVDLFTNINIILCELEIVTTKDKLDEMTDKLSNIEMPLFIQRNLITEVSDMTNFSNKSLSISL
tara:strand:+ start:92829 stop:93323 length:495 start_codon:yes stop_codon:yes gene_type:complete